MSEDKLQRRKLSLLSPHVDERIARWREIEKNIDAPTLDELPIVARALEIDVEQVRAWALFDEFEFLQRRWNVTPAQLVEFAQWHLLESEAEDGGAASIPCPARAQ